MFGFADGYLVVRLPGWEHAWASVRVSTEALAKLDNHKWKVVKLIITHGR